jgi:hypothetical protein
MLTYVPAVAEKDVPAAACVVVVLRGVVPDPPRVMIAYTSPRPIG